MPDTPSLSRDRAYSCLYSPDCLEEEFSEVHIQNPAYNHRYRAEAMADLFTRAPEVSTTYWGRE